MRKPTDSGRKKRHLVLIALLALLCVGGVELGASYFFAPDVYEQITAPVRQFCRAAVDLGGRAVSAAASASVSAASAVSAAASETAANVSQWWEEVAAEPEESETVEDQRASDPILSLDAPLLDPAITEFTEEDSLEILTGGIIPIVYYNQGDEAWADQPYGRDTIGPYGCGPTAMCMVVDSLTDTEEDPITMAQWASKNGCWASRSGSYLSIVEKTAKNYGLTAQAIPERTPEAIRSALLEGNLLVALMGPGHFTKSGHFIVLRGVTLSGAILVADPNSRPRSLLEWEPQVILDELSRSTSNGAPLWIISKNEDS